MKLSKDLASDGETKGFHLAGVDIPYPTGEFVKKTGSTSLASDAGLCWVQRCTKAGEVAWVLSLVNGVSPNDPSSCPKKSSIACGGSTSEDGNYTWQILKEHADIAHDVGSESCQDPNNCENCCINVVGVGQGNPYSQEGNTCTTKGATESKSGFFAEFRSEYINTSQPCTCSFNTVDYICQ